MVIVITVIIIVVAAVTRMGYHGHVNATKDLLLANAENYSVIVLKSRVSDSRLVYDSFGSAQ